MCQQIITHLRDRSFKRAHFTNIVVKSCRILLKLNFTPLSTKMLFGCWLLATETGFQVVFHRENTTQQREVIFRNCLGSLALFSYCLLLFHCGVRHKQFRVSSAVYISLFRLV